MSFSRKIWYMKTAVPLLVAGAVVCLCLCGCATSMESPIRRAQVCESTQSLRVAVLPPRICSELAPGNFRSEQPFFKQFLDGRGLVVTSADASYDIALEVVATLTQAGLYERVFLVEDRQEAERLGATGLLAVTVQDYRAVLLGANTSGFWVFLTSPLMSQYWLRWRTIEARFDWEAHLLSLESGETLYSKHLKRSYTSPVRSAFGKHFTNKMLSFLQKRAGPDFIGELFSLRMRSASADRSWQKIE